GISQFLNIKCALFSTKSVLLMIFPWPPTISSQAYAYKMQNVPFCIFIPTAHSSFSPLAVTEKVTALYRNHQSITRTETWSGKSSVLGRKYLMPPTNYYRN
ncbi:hypothetical protein ACSTBK_002810, partial [Escherichia coli]